MKKRISVLFLGLSCLLIACKTNTPSGVVGLFLKALAEQDFTTAKKYCSTEAKKSFELLESVLKMAPKNALDEAKKNKNRFKIIKEEVNGENAIVTYLNVKSNKEETLKMKKIEGKWLVTLDKADIGQKDTQPNKSNEPNGIDN